MEKEKYTCQYCGKEYQREAAFKKHLLICEDDGISIKVEDNGFVQEEVIVDDIITDIVRFFDGLKTPKMTGGFRIRRHLTESETKNIFVLYNRRYNTKKVVCRNCTSSTAKLYDKLKKIYENQIN